MDNKKRKLMIEQAIAYMNEAIQYCKENYGIMFTYKIEVKKETENKLVMQIARACCEVYEVSMQDYEVWNNKSRQSDIVNIRRGICYILRTYYGLTYDSIKAILQYHDHTTVYHHVNTYENYLVTDDDFREKHQKILEKLNIKTYEQKNEKNEW